jgi:hypothetical protein
VQGNVQHYNQHFWAWADRKEWDGLTHISKGREHFAMQCFYRMDPGDRIGDQGWMVLEVVDRESATFRRIAFGGVSNWAFREKQANRTCID